MIEAIDLCAGAGGLTLGFKEAGIKTILAVEIDRYCAQSLRRHSPEIEVRAEDIRNFDFKSLKGRIGLVYGGPPCQPFSSGGLRSAAHDKRNMIPWFVQAIRDVQPEAFFMENVPGLAAGDRVSYFSQVLGELLSASELASLGYHVNWKVINAADYGVPQNRRRLFVIGMRDHVFTFPKPTHGRGCGFDYVAVKDVLPPYQIGDANPSRVFYARRPDLRPSPYDGHLFNGGGRPINRDRPCHTILASAGGNKTHFFDELGLAPQYHRYLMEGGAPREGTLEGARRLTVLESAIIQTFPSGLVFAGPRSSQYLQVGNAVPPRLATEIGRALIRQMLGQPHETAELCEPLQGVLL